MTASDPIPPADQPDGYVVGLIGDGIGRSLTPPMHMVEAARLGLDYDYRIFDLIELGLPADAVGGLLASARDRGYAAMNVTHPCKQLALEIVDELDGDAQRLGAVNLVVFEGGRMTGWNTDWLGYRDGLREGLPDADLGEVVQLGCGGAGAATAYALLSSGAEHLVLSDADADRAGALAERLQALFPAQRVSAVVDVDAPLARCTGVVHATPTGMAHHPGIAVDLDLLARDAWVSEVVYRPLRTELVQRAEAAGRRVLDGGRMAVGQAVSSMEIITGIRADRQRMREHFLALIDDEEHAG
ncbi:shikimate dehydrogenase [Microbacterium fluvii]|uniref:Shikimate dehydrogenase n=1 Tax=Microbacterium fluvii TaxID=415215 RepID=A0ABW2HHG3_9MICO|nr:shikimate dehydrogenase [Microbacterium fluvii]MCU4673095.1 shikimate dehydrogenase [Microbacterium fluvii]